jgi:hypothetical protein
MYKSLLFYLLLFSVTEMQAQGFPKTIYEMYNLQPGGCDYSVEPGVRDEAIAEFAPPPPPPPPSPYAENQLSPGEIVTNLLVDYKKAIASQKDLKIETTYDLRNGGQCFFKNGKWGYKNAAGKIILKPQFEVVAVDTFAGGFVGYGMTMGNYYDGETGKKVLKNDYYYIKPVGKKTFIVQTKEGYGVLNDGKIVVEATQRQIDVGGRGSEITLSIRGKDEARSLLLSDFKTLVPYSSFQRPRVVDERYLVTTTNLLDVQENKKMLCESNFSITLISGKEQLLFIKKGREKSGFLIDFAGNILSEQPFTSVTAFGKMNQGIATVIESAAGQVRPTTKYGLIDTKGNWVVKPKYERLMRYNDYFLATNIDKKQGMFDKTGKEIIPMEYDLIRKIDDQRFLVGTRTRKEAQTKIINIVTGKTERDNLDIVSMRPFKKYDKGYWLTESPHGEQIIDKDWKPVTERHVRIFSEGKYMEGLNKEKPEVGRQNVLYDENGKRVSFKVNGQKMETFQSEKLLSDDLFHIYFADKTGYVIPTKGKPQPLNQNIQSVYPAKIGNFLTLSAYGNGGAGMIDGDGKTVIPFDFKYLGGLNVATQLIGFTTKSGKAGFIKTDGNLLSETLYDQQNYVGLGLYKVGKGPKQSRKFGVMNKDGVLVLPIKYTSLYMRGGLIYVREKKGANEIVFNRQGKKVE